MPKPFKPTRPFPLPADADIVDQSGRLYVRMKERGKPVLYPLTRDGKQYLRPAKCWYFKLRDQNGIVRRIKGYADLKATEQLAAEMERKVSRIRSGFADPAEEHIRRPLADHLKDYTAHLEGKGGTVDHIKLTTGRLTSLFTGCGFAFPLDADPAKATDWLNSLRRDTIPVVIPDQESFTPAETAKLLGISGAAIRAGLKRLKLSATGHGKTRRYPRATVEALVRRAGKGHGPETVNHYIRAVRGFFRWLVRTKRIGSNPLESLTLVNAAADQRRTRRELTAAELQRLFTAARNSSRSYRGLSGVDRYFLYLVAAGTGFRANALANLTPADFDLEARTPVVTLAARFNKSRKPKVQPLPADVAAALRDYLSGKSMGSPIWGGTWARDHRGAEMLRFDLEAAGIAYAVEGPDGPEYADFHSLRHSYLTLGGRSGIDLRTLQELAGHSKPELTARYSHRRLYDLAGAVDKLPNLVPITPENSQLPLRLTGTEGATVAPSGAPPGAPPGAPAGGTERHQSARAYTFGIVGGTSDDSPQPLETQGAGTSRHRPASTCTSEDDGTRTRNHRIDSPLIAYRKPKKTKSLGPSDSAGCTTGCTRRESEGGITDPDLTALVVAWPTLPEHIRAAIKALVGTVAPPPPPLGPSR